ncbi:WG repeat-containing protein, partial [Megasphaera sp.]|uniref:WG repeat-containing protein n=1 Tax=Megasphaera sp. TaxID=2023260 RepID=UPI003FEF3655
FNWGGFLAGALIGSSTHSVYYDDEVMPLTYDGVKRGYLDRVGNIVIDSKNDAVYPMTEFGTFVRNKGKLGFVNRKGQYLIAPGNYTLDDGLLDDVDGFVSLKDKKNGKWGVFSMVDGAQVVDFAYDGVQFLGAQRLLLTKGDKNMLINQETGAFVAEFPASVKWMAFLLDDYTWCWNDKKEYAIVDRNGQVQYRAAAGQIQDVQGFRNGLTPVKTKTGWGIMDHQGQWIVKPQYKDITMV